MVEPFLNPPEGRTYLRNPSRQTPHGEFADVGSWVPDMLAMLATLLSLGSATSPVLGMVPPHMGRGLVPRTREAIPYVDWVENSLPKLAAAISNKVPRRVGVRVPPSENPTRSVLDFSPRRSIEIEMHTPETAKEHGVNLPGPPYVDLITNLLKVLYHRKNTEMFGKTAVSPYAPVMPQAEQITRKFYPESDLAEQVLGEVGTRSRAVDALANNMFKRLFIKPHREE